MDTPLAALSANYETVTTKFAYVSPGWKKILMADPRRWYVKFIPLGAVVGNVGFLPGLFDKSELTAWTLAENPEYKYKDVPGMPGREWWVNGGANQTIWVIEHLYLRG